MIKTQTKAFCQKQYHCALKDETWLLMLYFFIFYFFITEAFLWAKISQYSIYIYYLAWYHLTVWSCVFFVLTIGSTSTVLSSYPNHPPFHLTYTMHIHVITHSPLSSGGDWMHLHLHLCLLRFLIAIFQRFKPRAPESKSFHVPSTTFIFIYLKPVFTFMTQFKLDKSEIRFTSLIDNIVLVIQLAPPSYDMFVILINIFLKPTYLREKKAV